MSNKDNYLELVEQAIYEAERERVISNQRVLDIPTLGSNRIKHFVNSLCSNDEIKTFIDLGCFRGATTVAAGHNNDVHCYAVDHYRYNPYEGHPFDQDGWDSVRQGLKDNLRMFEIASKATSFDCNAPDIELDKIKSSIDVCFIDIDAVSSQNTITHLAELFSEHCIIVSPNLREEDKIKNIERGIANSGFGIVKTYTLPSRSMEDSSGWWNGLYIWVISKVNNTTIKTKEIKKPETTKTETVKKENTKNESKKNEEKKRS